MIDTVHTVETPEGVRLDLRAAGPVPRALAFLLDAFIRSILYVAFVVGAVTLVPNVADALALLVIFLGEWLYPVFFEVWSRGQTIGKRVVGLRVVRDDGTRVGWSASLLRNLLLSADFVPGTYAAGLASMLASRSFQRLGDHAAGTLVVYADPVSSAPEGEATPAPVAVPPMAPPVPLTVAEQRAVIAFAERAPHLSDARADELAALPAPLLSPPQPARERLLAIAAWLLGRTGAERA
jgi:uncharacterized RDD family membrane protein YckC